MISFLFISSLLTIVYVGIGAIFLTFSIRQEASEGFNVKVLSEMDPTYYTSLCVCLTWPAFACVTLVGVCAPLADFLTPVSKGLRDFAYWLDEVLPGENSAQLFLKASKQRKEEGHAACTSATCCEDNNQ